MAAWKGDECVTMMPAAVVLPGLYPILRSGCISSVVAGSHTTVNSHSRLAVELDAEPERQKCFKGLDEDHQKLPDDAGIDDEQQWNTAQRLRE